MARQNPWDTAPVVPLQELQAGEQAPRGQVVRRPDGSAYVVTNREYTNETPTQLLNQGYMPDESGTYVRTQTVDYADAPWNQVQPLAPEQLAAATTPLQSGQAEAFSAAATEQIPFLDEAAAFTTGLITGTPYSEVRQLQQDLKGYDRQNYGAARNAGGVAGFAAGLAAPGSSYIQGARGAAAVGRAATVGGAYGGLYGLGAGEGSLLDRAPGGAVGVVTGAVGGAGLQALGNAAPSIASRLRSIANPNSPPPIRGDAEQRAAARVVRAIGQDQGGAATERSRLADLGVNPALIDVAGGTTERLVRTAAAPAGEGANLAVSNVVARQADLRPEIMSMTQDLSRDSRSLGAIRQGIEDTRSGLARIDYASGYQAPVELTAPAIRSLRGSDGQAAIERAMLGAQANGDEAAIAELQSLLTADLDSPPVITAGTLDRVRIAMRDMGQNFTRGDNPDRVRASGYASRVEGIDNALDNVLPIRPARATYRDLSGALDVIDERPNVFNTDPRDFSQWASGLSQSQREAAVAAFRQDILDRLGGEASSGVGSLNRMAQSNYYRQNLSSLLGDVDANAYLDSISQRVQQTQRAARVSPNTNSQTFGRALDENQFNAADAASAVADVGQSFTGNLAAIGRTVERIRSRASMSPQEREAVVRFGLGSADELERIVMLADSARRQRRPVPRQVRRFLEGVRNTSGAQVADEIQRAILPMRTTAEEESPQR